MRRIGARLARLTVLAVTAVAAGGLFTTGPAAAHARLVDSDPQADSTVTTPLDEITLTFSELIRGALSTVVVTGPDGVRHGTGEPRVVDRRLYLPVDPMRSGSYRVAYRVVSADGHPIEGQFRFAVALPPALEPHPVSTTGAAPPDGPETSPVASAPGGDSSGVGVWWVGAVVVAGAALVTAGIIAVRRARRTPRR